MRQIPEQFTASSIAKIFQIQMSKTGFLNLEERGVIPRATRTQRGKSSYRYWKLNDLPQIGQALGYLKPPTSPQVISMFSLKGGTGKSTLTFQFARALALHGVRTLVIGLDAQESVTQTIDHRRTTENQDQSDLAAQNETGILSPGVYDIVTGTCSAVDAILSSDLETLSYIPERIELSVLDRFLSTRTRKEYVIKERVVDPILASGLYDVILFDCNPAWTDTVTGALGASDMLISPMGCDLNSLRAASIFVNLLEDFATDMRKVFRQILLVPTLAEGNKMSQQVLARYRIDYENICTVAFLRRAIIMQEANALGASMIEVGNKSPVYQDLVGIFKEINQAMLDQNSQDHENDASATRYQLAGSAEAQT